MSHVRQQIREAVRAQLAGIAGVTVVNWRMHSQLSLPAIEVYTPGESIGPLEVDSPGANRRYDRYATLRVDVLVEAEAGYEDASDAIAVEVEKAIAGDLTLGGLSLETEFIATTEELDDRDADPLATVSLEYRVWYRTRALDPETTI